jgi:acetoin utilization deacetylase AcuC-like enzyme
MFQGFLGSISPEPAGGISEMTGDPVSKEGNSAEITGVLRDVRFLSHIAGSGHVESPGRLRVIYECLDRPEEAALYQTVAPRMATREELGWNHAPEYIERIARTEGRDFRWLDPDTMTSAGSWEAACLAVGGVFNLLDAIAAKRLKNGLALVRPPGHHAEKDEARGFCLFNNVALGAHYAREVLGYGRILIVDWDLHHGNGTQHSFYSNPEVLYFSTHQYPHYPGTGAVEHIGEGAGRGFTVNVPLSPGAGDTDFAAIFGRLLVPIAESFSPDFILVSAGFDIYEGDPLGGMRVTSAGFAWLANVLLELAVRYCDGRILFCLEGGYNPTGLREGVRAVLHECAGCSLLGEKTRMQLQSPGNGLRVIDQVIDVQRDYWPLSQ